MQNEQTSRASEEALVSLHLPGLRDRGGQASGWELVGQN